MSKTVIYTYTIEVPVSMTDEDLQKYLNDEDGDTFVEIESNNMAVAEARIVSYLSGAIDESLNVIVESEVE
jgi:hypothetical protein